MLTDWTERPIPLEVGWAWEVQTHYAAAAFVFDENVWDLWEYEESFFVPAWIDELLMRGLITSKRETRPTFSDGPRVECSWVSFPYAPIHHWLVTS